MTLNTQIHSMTIATLKEVRQILEAYLSSLSIDLPYKDALKALLSDNKSRTLADEALTHLVKGVTTIKTTSDIGNLWGIKKQILEVLINQIRAFANEQHLSDEIPVILESVHLAMTGDVAVEHLFDTSDVRILVRVAAACGHVNIMSNFPDEKIKEAVKACDYWAYQVAANYGHFDTLKYIESKLSDEERKAALQAWDYWGYQEAVRGGHLGILEHMESRLSEEEIKAAIQARNYSAYRDVARKGHLNIIEHMDNKLSDEEQKAALKAGEYMAYREAVGGGRLDILQYIENRLSEEEIKAAIQSGEYQPYHYAARCGHLDAMQHMETKLSEEEIKAAIQARNYSAYRDVARKGHLNIIEHMDNKLSDEEQKAALKAGEYMAYREAVGGGRLDILQYIENRLSEEEIKAAIHPYDYLVYREAARDGHFEIIRHLDSKLSEEDRKEAVKAHDYQIYRDVAEGGYLDIVQHIESILSEDEIKAAVQIQHYLTYRAAAHYGHFDTLKYIESKLSEEEKKAAIQAQDYLAYQYAAYGGYLDILLFMESRLSEEEIKAAIQARDYRPYREAARRGHFEIIRHMESKLNGEEKKAAVQAEEYQSYREAVLAGRLDIIRHMESHLNNRERKAAIQAHNYLAYQFAAADGRLSIIEHMERMLNAEEKTSAVKSQDYRAYQDADYENHLDTMQHLLGITACLAYAEQHDMEYGKKSVYSYVTSTVNSLKQLKDDFERANEDGVFNLDEQQATHCYYLLRNLIRRGVERDYEEDGRREAESLADDIRFLMSIPALCSLCHQTVTVDEDSPGQENELLRLAIRLGNQEAIDLLLQLPQVRDTAERANYYSNEMGGDIDLRQLAADAESSMVALSQDESARLEDLNKHYAETIESLGGANLFSALKETLKDRFEDNPACFHYRGAALELPFEWQAFNQLASEKEFTQEEKTKALQAYYHHKDHTAYRYLSKPNPWISKKASYVEVSADRQERWSTFERYIPLIILLWYAAQDESEEATDGHTLEGRMNHFIDELSLLGRAHNWDKYYLNAKGKKVYFDDLEADKPSCYSGVKRRLFQSVIGHRLMSYFGYNVLDLEISCFVYEYYKELIDEGNVGVLHEYVNAVDELEELTQQQSRALLELSIPDEKINQFKEELYQRFKKFFDKNQGFKIYVEQRFSLNQMQETGYFSKFYSSANLSLLLERYPQAATENTNADTEVKSKKVQLMAKIRKLETGVTAENSLYFFQGINKGQAKTLKTLMECLEKDDVNRLYELSSGMMQGDKSAFTEKFLQLLQDIIAYSEEQPAIACSST